jgi:hypothetical protein
MRTRSAILGLGLLAGCQGGGGPIGSASAVESAPASPPPARETATAAEAPRASAKTAAMPVPAAGAIATLKADSLREMEAVRGKRVEVGGIFIKRTVARQGGFPSEHPLIINNTVWLADSKDGTDLLRCDLGDGWAAGVEPPDRIMVEGIAAFEDPSTIHNGPKELRIARCTVKKAQ